MKYKNILAIGLGLFAVFVALVVVDELAVAEPVTQSKPAPKQPVSVVVVSPQPHTPSLTLLGNTRARHVTQLRVSSNGQLAWLDTSLEPGTLVSEGAPLAKLDMTHLASELAQAQSRVRHAELALEQQLHEQAVALRMLSENNQSSYAKREPQVAAAESDLTQARLALQSTNKLVQEAHITAPFNAVVLSRTVSPSDWLSAGEALFEVASSASMDVEMPISEPIWGKLLPQLQANAVTIDVIDRSGKHWPAQVRFIDPKVDLTTRQRQVVLKVANPYQELVSLMPNQPVQVSIRMISEPLSFQVPHSAMTRDGFIWTINEENSLQKEAVEVLSKNDEFTYVRFANLPDKARKVVEYPLLSMLVGTEVSPEISSEISSEISPKSNSVRLVSREESQ
ncbi:efflux RND transporter periplasmic adaptor subunit [Pseudoalteromonas luteoviolacea]|uniref:efflux RND transporter periplasmic adaptor subunit n=1 Tax=Pseudoalteromonas luteoviolacea TaxID=43657 RepID=UPI00114EEB27|nr:efflux RND transporter periplasmic adaptor subunit [Pseudoalteromonas luteoviolacea]TQF71112.1 efflux RND transporter periplasmic adaptor subunit [Pseudoalteromonas luteoviolacea]